MNPSLLNPAWKYHGSATHADSEPFRRRQRARMLREQRRQQVERQTQSNVASLRKVRP